MLRQISPFASWRSEQAMLACVIATKIDNADNLTFYVDLKI